MITKVSLLVAALALAACSGPRPAASPAPATSTSAGGSTSTAPVTSAAPPTTASPVKLPATEATPRPTFLPPTPVALSTAPTIPPAVEHGEHAFPVDPNVTTSWTPRSHHDYPATDIFASTNCGTHVFSPVNGTVAERIVDHYVRSVDDPATRGGNAVSILGEDGVRYYMAHFESVDAAITAGAHVNAGQFVGLEGETGDAGACHVHFGLSLPCPNEDWWVRRGVIWPDDYLASWKSGGNASPVAELKAWFAAHPNACRSPQDIPYPIGS